VTQRPTLHLTPRRGWLNDPLGLTWRNGRYDLFFQAVPSETA
jgi:beta-fructofuranosidase